MPLWVKILIIVLVLPVLFYPWMLSVAPPSFGQGTERVLLWLYPAYVMVAAVCAWMCWKNRRETAWILIFLMLLTHASMIYLVCQG